jgi:ketopantoate reductase
MGPADGADLARAEAVCAVWRSAVWRSAGFRAEAVRDVQTMIWAKLGLDAPVNRTLALLVQAMEERAARRSWAARRSRRARPYRSTSAGRVSASRATSASARAASG